MDQSILFRHHCSSVASKCFGRTFSDLSAAPSISDSLVFYERLVASSPARRVLAMAAAPSSTEDEVKLLAFWPSPYVQRVQVALEAKRIKYETISEDLENKSELLLKSNPIHKKVPVLIHNGNPVLESIIILHYLDESWPGNDQDIPSFLPKDPLGKAKARFWAEFIDRKILDAILQAVKSKDSGGITENLAILEEELTKHTETFFGGKSLGLPDIVLSPIAVWFPAFVESAGLPLAGPKELPCLYKLLDAIRSHPAGAAALPDVAKHREFAERRREKKQHE